MFGRERERERESERERKREETEKERKRERQGNSYRQTDRQTMTLKESNFVMICHWQSFSWMEWHRGTTMISCIYLQ